MRPYQKQLPTVKRIRPDLAAFVDQLIQAAPRPTPCDHYEMVKREIRAASRGDERQYQLGVRRFVEVLL